MSPRDAIRALLLLLAPSCAAAPDVTVAELTCSHPFKAGGFIGLYSLQQGELALPVERVEDVDLVTYYDRDDCERGALMGADDRAGFLFPIGHRDWDELEDLEPPAADAPSVEAITPLDSEQVGLAFWLRTGRGEPVLVRIAEVQEATYAELVAGRVPVLALEWRR